jgi:hypothetical protein
MPLSLSSIEQKTVMAPVLQSRKSEDAPEANGAENVSSLETTLLKWLAAQKQPEPERFDLTRGYIPVIMALGILATAIAGTFETGRVYESYKLEQSSLVKRLEIVEGKLDQIMSWILQKK